MSLKFFRIPCRNSDVDEQALTAFLAQHRIVSIDKQFVDDGQSSFWAICVDYLDLKNSAPDARATGKRIDYKEVLPPDEFAVFARLRDLRKALADQEAVPAYAIFTNEQLATMARNKVSTIDDLKKVDGVGDARVKKYGQKMIEALASAPESPSST